MRKYFAAPRTFFSLMISFMLLGVGNVINDAIGNHISLEAIGIIGAYYTVEMLVIAIWSLGFKTYVVKRVNERGLFSVQVVYGLVCGLAMFFGAEGIAGLFGISDEMRQVLADMLRLGVVYTPIDAACTYLFDVTRLQEKLKAYRHGLVMFYVVSISANLVMFALVREPICVLFATLAAYAVCSVYLARSIEWGGTWVPSGDVWAVCWKVGAPLCGTDVVKRCGTGCMSMFASFLPVEYYAVFIVCQNAVIESDLANEAYSNTLLIMLPTDGARDEAQYRAGREKLCELRRSTSATACLAGIGFAYLFAVITCGSADFWLAMAVVTVYIPNYVLMTVCTQMQDWLTICGRTRDVFAGICMVSPAWVVVPWLAVMVCPPEVGVFVMASTGFFQTTGRALWYYHKVKQLDRQFGWEADMAPADMDTCMAKGE